MNLTPDRSGDVQLRRARAKAIGRASRMIEGAGLEITEHAYELVITNPRDPERGQVHLAYADGYVCWERVTWDYWGHLEGYEDSMCDTDRGIGAGKILHALTANDSVHGGYSSGRGFVMTPGSRRHGVRLGGTRSRRADATSWLKARGEVR